MLLICILICAISILAVGPAYRPATLAAAAPPPLTWYRGNTHAHTTNSDGDSSPLAVASRYRELGYNFLFITDHNKLTDVSSLNAELAVPGQFLVMQGEEVTDSFSGKPVHLNGLNNNVLVLPQHGSDVLNTMDNDVAAISQAGGLPCIDHPNYGFAISSSDLKNFTGTQLFEVYNAHPVVNNVGDATHPSVEAMWDEALSSGKLLYGLAVDDEHTLVNPVGALPGRAWVMVRAGSLDAYTITQAIRSGDFYASTGVTLQDYQVSSTSVSITVDDPTQPFTIDFIGKNGRLLQRTTTSPATYIFTGDEMYVRAKILNSAGQAAWTQPVYTASLSAGNAIVNGASVGNEPQVDKEVAPASIAIASGLGLANVTLQAEPEPDDSFPMSLGGTSVTINGRPAPIYFVSSRQVNFYVPDETELGPAEVVVTNSDGVQLHCRTTVATRAPGIFTADGTGRGNAVTVDVNTLLSQPLIPNDHERRLIIYATGVRGATMVTVMINDRPVMIEAQKHCGHLPGLDQLNIALPPDMIIVGAARLVITADGWASNTTTLNL